MTLYQRPTGDGGGEDLAPLSLCRTHVYDMKLCHAPLRPSGRGADFPAVPRMGFPAAQNALQPRKSKHSWGLNLLVWTEKTLQQQWSSWGSCCVTQKHDAFFITSIYWDLRKSNPFYTGSLSDLLSSVLLNLGFELLLNSNFSSWSKPTDSQRILVTV